MLQAIEKAPVVAEGTYGKVKKVVFQGQTYGVKLLPRNVNLSEQRDIVKEIHYLNTLKHPHILPLNKELLLKDSIALCSPWYHMDLHNFIQRLRYDEGYVKKIVRQIAEALKYVHSKEVMHLDVKPSNVLLDGDFNAVLGDFGMAEPTHTHRRYGTEIVTRWYRPPEVWREEKPTTKADIWSLGCVAYELAYKKPLFPIPTDDSKVALLEVERYHTFAPQNDLEKFVKFMLTMDPNKRPSAQEVLEHAYLN